jgi:GNAT superfamily N-acetyltransferase
MPKDQMNIIFSIRLASRKDIPALRAMQERSFLVLGAAFYAPQEIAGFISRIGTMDDAVIDEGHYFVADQAGAILGSGGWSQMEPGYDRSRTAGPADGARSGVGTVRSVFVDPAAARCGIASALMGHIERDAFRHGVHLLRLMATLSGLPFYKRLGWATEGEKTIDLGGGLRFGCVSMSKPIAFHAPHDTGPAHELGASQQQSTQFAAR